MIRVVTSANIASNAHYVAAFAALRHRVLIERLGWDMKSAAQGFEYDRFDTSDAVYLLVCNEEDNVVAGVRLLKTTSPCVLADCFPQLAEGAIPASEAVWEVTRFVVDPDAAKAAGNRALGTKLVWALQSYGLMAGLSSFVSVSYAGMERLLGSVGCRFRRLGSPRTIDGRVVVALSFEIAEDILAKVEGRLFAPAAPAGSDMVGENARHMTRPDFVAWPECVGPGSGLAPLQRAA
jgi:N-acyl-L-homoserine lactone synthetase